MAESVRGRLRWPVRRREEATAEDIAARDIAQMEVADQLPPPLPEPMGLPEPPQRFNLAILRLAGLGLALVLALTLTMVKLFVTGPPSLADLRAQAGVNSWTTLSVGVKDDQPGIAYYDPGSKECAARPPAGGCGTWSGFDIDIAYMIAEDLGFRRQDVRFYAIESEDRGRMQAADPQGNRVAVKMVIASYSITQDRIDQGATFSYPYLYTEESALTLAGHSPVATFEDLAHKRVCSLSASTSITAPEQAGATVVRKNKISECIALLRSKGPDRVDAVSTDAAILAGYKYQHPQEFHHWDLGYDSTEKWGVNVGDNDALKTLVDATLYKSYKDPHDDRWELAYAHNLQVETRASQDDHTPIAVAEQPRAARPDVRKLPWEDSVP
ncbi:transporter substrate-binding domain-containing protein [Actinoplanes sp. NPDC051411]|uniref:transporter substrate-binding domain-containing protein n=1 Tax=Actinoplanes sp. NPDC051411 TaxID=3155522 RepID=UPI0034334984